MDELSHLDFRSGLPHPVPEGALCGKIECAPIRIHIVISARKQRHSQIDDRIPRENACSGCLLNALLDATYPFGRYYFVGDLVYELKT